MIKLIATDMDGTLLDDKGKLPKNFFEVLNKLKEKDVKFVVASGRPYFTLYQGFKPVSDDIYYICDNGAYVVENKDNINIEVMDKNIVKDIVNECAKIDNAEVVLCGTKGAYHINIDKKYTDEIDKYYIEKKVVEDLLEVDDHIFKIAICDIPNSAQNSYKILNEKFGKDHMVVVSGQYWVDIANKNVNKGIALEKIQKDFNISKEETMVFGDFYNDVEMLKKAKYSFVMENANDDMKKYGNYIAKSNIENGVIEAIEEYVLKF